MTGSRAQYASILFSRSHRQHARPVAPSRLSQAQSATDTYTVDPDGAGPSPSFDFQDPTFDVRNLRGNAVLRWEYRPGSALFVVWQQQRSDSEPFGDFNPVRDVGGIFRSIPTNILLVKATYWIGR